MIASKILALKPCPFCGKKLFHVYGKRVNRYYKGEPTGYSHYSPGCLLNGIEISDKNIIAWNTRNIKGGI